MSDVKALPKPDPVSQPYWDSLKAHALCLQRCDDCRKVIFYPRALCPACGSRALIWAPMSGRGHVYAFTITHRAAPAGFKVETPYVVAIVELEEGARMMTNLVRVDAAPDRVRIGMPVEIVYDDVTDAITLPKFKPR